MKADASTKVVTMKFWASLIASAVTVCVWCGGRAAPAVAATQAASNAGVSATLSYSYDKKSGVYTDMHLKIVRDGHQLLSQALKVPGVCGTYCGPLSAESLLVEKLEGAGEATVLVRLYSGGAHCCEVDEAFTYNSRAATYTESAEDFGNYGEQLKRLDGRYVFESENNDFAYAFTDYAASGAPLELFTLKNGRFVNVTRSYPKLIADDAARWLKAFEDAAPQYVDTTGLIAAWAADEDELGNGAKVAAYLAEQAASGHLNSGISGEPKGVKYVKALDRFLRQEGYLR
jgi:hypothetical protein